VRRPFAFPKSNKLKSVTTITRLFEAGTSEFVYPIKLVFLKEKNELHFETFKAGVSVPKKLFKKAVDRNTIKRRLREAIRFHQQPIYQYCIDQTCHYNMMLIYVGKEIMTGQQIDKAVRSLFEKLIKDV
jgi:ribonuclease P protein component